MPLKVIVVGGSIGGPAVGAALARNGHSVTIYERSPSNLQTGHAFRVTNNSDLCLKYLGIDTIAGGASVANTSKTLDMHGNVQWAMAENTDEKVKKKGTSVFASRPQVAQQLIDTAKKYGAEVKTGVKVQGVNVDQTTITLEDGTEVSADLIIGADGIYSTIRSGVVDTAKYKPNHTLEVNAIRFVIPRSRLQNDEVLSDLFTDEYRMINWQGDQNRLIISYPCDYDKHHAFVCSHPAHMSNRAADDQSAATATSYDKSVSKETIQKIHEGFDPRVHRVFDLVDEDDFRIWKLQDLEELPRWSVNRTVLIGDAAHAVLPFSFSGAGTTIEDSVVLGELLPADVRVEDIPRRLQVFEQLRKPRLKRVKESSYLIAKGAHPQEIGYMQYMTEYDAVEVGRKALQDCLSGSASN